MAAAGSLVGLALQSGLSPRSVLEPREVFFKEFKGALTEQFVQQELRTAHGMIPHYWSTADSRTEVDFLVEVDGRVIPVEAKAEQNLRAKSLKSYREKWNPLFAVRTSLSGMREDEGLKNIPLYAIGGKYVLKTDKVSLYAEAPVLPLYPSTHLLLYTAKYNVQSHIHHCREMLFDF